MKRVLTRAQKRIIDSGYADRPTREIASETGLPIRAIYDYAAYRGLKKSREAISAASLGHPPNRGCFKKGHVPSNKGKAMPDSVRAKVARTMFAKGNIPSNAKYDGCISVRRDNGSGRDYLYIRIDAGKWVPLHRLLWEQTNGPVPKGCVVSFRDSNSLNCTLENLEIMTRYENRVRNSFWRLLPPEIADLKHIIASVRHRITNINRITTHKRSNEK